MTLLEKELIVKKSTISRAGKGLFTKVFIAEGTFIIEYRGKITSWNDADHDDGNNAYIYYVTRNHVIDAKDHTNEPGRYVNDGTGPCGSNGIKNNSEYINKGKRVFIKSVIDIPAGSEILVGYGKGYWDVLAHNKAS